MRAGKMVEEKRDPQPSRSISDSTSPQPHYTESVNMYLAHLSLIFYFSLSEYGR